MNERQYVSALYFDKLQTALLYREASRMLKEFSDAVYERFSEFSAQDMVHAVSLHGMMSALMAKNPSMEAAIEITPDMIEGIGARRHEEEEPNNFGIAKAWCDRLGMAEARIANLVEGVEKECQGLLDFSQEFISITGLRVIAEDRVAALGNLKSKIEADKCQLFNRSDENQIWKCLNCGMTSVGMEAPQECPCCLAPQGMQEAGDWRIP